MEINLPVQTEHRKLKARWTMEAAQDMKFWHELNSQYSQDNSNAMFKPSDFIFIDEVAFRKPKKVLRSLDDEWES